MPIKKTRKKERKGVSKEFDSRKGAFREFKRDYDIPYSEHPKKVMTPDSNGGDNYQLDERNKRLYIFEEKKMITLKTSNNIFYNRRVILDYFRSDLFKTDHEMEDINWLELRISGDNNEELFEEFLEDFFSILKKDFLIDIFSYQRSEQVKSRLRSYGKLFFGLRKENLIDPNFLIEKELETDENHSIFAGIIQVDEVDNEIIFNEIFGNYFRFGHVALESPVKSNRLETLLDRVDLKLLRKRKFIEIDYLTLLGRLVNPSSSVFSYLFDGKDDLVFTLYGGNEIFNLIEEIICKSLPKDVKLDKISADSKVIDRLMDSYFKDWRTSYTQGP